VDYGVVFLESDGNVFLLEELGEVLPVVLLLFKLETVVELIHLNVVWVIARQNLGKHPAVGQISLGVRNLVG